MPAKTLDQIFTFKGTPKLILNKDKKTPVCTYFEGKSDKYLLEQFRNTEDTTLLIAPMTENVLIETKDGIQLIAEKRIVKDLENNLWVQFNEEFEDLIMMPLNLKYGPNIKESKGKIKWFKYDLKGNILDKDTGYYHDITDTFLPLEGDGTICYQREKFWQEMGGATSIKEETPPAYDRKLCFKKDSGILWWYDYLTEEIACIPELMEKN